MVGWGGALSPQAPLSALLRRKAPLSVVNLPIYFSSGADYKWARPEATTARFGHGSTAAGQGAKGRDKRWSRGPRLPQPGKRPGWRGGGLLSCAAVSSTANLLVSEAGRKFYFGSQASLPESKRSALAVSLFLFDPPTHPGNRCSGEQGGVAVAASSSGAGSGGLQGTRAGASVREQAQSALIQC